MFGAPSVAATASTAADPFGVPPAPPAAASPRSGADGGASKRPSVFDPFNDGQPEPPEGVEDPEEANGDDEEDEDGAGMLELQATQQPDKQDLYEVVFEHETKLGMLLEKQEDWTPGTASEARKERTVVKMVIENGAADVRGVMVGSKVVRINSTDVMSKPYTEVLNMVKELPRPLAITLETSRAACDASQGPCLFYKSSSWYPPSSYGTWQQRYFVIGGAVAKPHVLQIYESKAEYEAVVVKMFQHEKPTGMKVRSSRRALSAATRPPSRVRVSLSRAQFKAYSVSRSFKLGPVREKQYRLAGTTIKYFSLKNPKSRTKTMKIAAQNASVVQALHSQLSKLT